MTTAKASVVAIVATISILVGSAAQAATVFILLSVVGTSDMHGAVIQFNFSNETALYSVSPPAGDHIAVTFNSTTFTNVSPSIAPGIGIKSVVLQQHGRDAIAIITTERPVQIRAQPNPLSLQIFLDFSGSAPSAAAAQPVATNGQVTRLVYLRHAKVDEIASLLSSQVGATPQVGSAQTILAQSPMSSGGLSGYGYPTTVQDGQLHLAQGDQLGAYRISENVAVDRRLNAVVLTGPPDVVNNLAAEVAAVDIPDQPQTTVRLSAQIYEITESAARNIGINFSNNGPTAQAVLTAQSLQPSQALASFQAQLFAQISNGHGKLVSSPNLQTLDGSVASILTGDALPIVTTITYPGNPPTVQQQLQYVNVGVHLQVEPYVGDDGYVTSVVLVEVSNVTGFIQGNIPQISQRQAISTVRVRTGMPFVIGGLLQDNDIKSLSRVPVLSSIPLLGEFFKYRTSTKERTNLIVVITPTVEVQN